MNQVLVRTIMHFVHFLDTCDEEVLDEDQAVSLQEEIAAMLLELGPKERARLRKVMSMVAKAEADPERRETFSGLFESMGLDD